MTKLAKESKHQISHLIGSKKEKADVYLDPDCPVKILLEAALHVSERGNYDEGDYAIIEALISNPATPTDAINLLDTIFAENSTIFPYFKQKLGRHINHSERRKNIISQIKTDSDFFGQFQKIANGNQQILFTLLNSCFLAGNSLNTFINHTIVNDYDFFFKNATTASWFLSHVLSLALDEDIRGRKVLIEGNRVSVDHSNKIRFKWKEYDILITCNAVTFSGGGMSRPFQFITKACGSPDEVTANFDFAHCKSYFDIKEEHLCFPLKSIISTQKRKLIFDGGLNPLNSLLRVKKFERYGWRINNREILKIAYALSNFDLSNPENLKLLTGFYGEDFGEYWEQMLSKKNKDKGSKVTFEDICDFVDIVDSKAEEIRKKHKNNWHLNF